MKNIAVWGLPLYREWLGIPFLKKLKAAEGASIHLIGSIGKSVEYWKRLDPEGVIDSFTTTGHFFFEYDKCDDPPEEIYAKARHYEDKYNTLVVDILQTDRHLGRGFAANGIGHPKSRLSNKAVYLKSANMFNKIIAFWENYFETTKAELVIGAAIGIIGKSCTVVARKKNIPVRLLTLSKFKAYYHWAFDEYYSCPDIKEQFNSIRDHRELVKEEELNEAIQSPDATGYQGFADIISKSVLLKRAARQVRIHISRKLHGIVSMGNYMLSEDLKCLWNAHRDLNTMKKFKMLKKEELAGKSYVFFPLHCEPEAALGTFSPEFNEQLALIELVAKNLPAGTLLAVKEHLAAFGRRPGDFYRTISEIPNAVMVSLHENALEIAKEARCVAIIASTLGTEAALFGIPVISFGAHNNFNFLPHVHVVESWKELRPLLHKICGEDPDEARKRHEETGKRYLAAVKASSIKLNSTGPTSLDQKTQSKSDAQVLYSSLKRSLGRDV